MTSGRKNTKNQSKSSVKKQVKVTNEDKGLNKNKKLMKGVMDDADFFFLKSFTSKKSSDKELRNLEEKRKKDEYMNNIQQEYLTMTLSQGNLLLYNLNYYSLFKFGKFKIYLFENSIKELFYIHLFKQKIMDFIYIILLIKY